MIALSKVCKESLLNKGCYYIYYVYYCFNLPKSKGGTLVEESFPFIIELLLSWLDSFIRGLEFVFKSYFYDAVNLSISFLDSNN
jgi:hypothetical protein